MLITITRQILSADHESSDTSDMPLTTQRWLWLLKNKLELWTEESPGKIHFYVDAKSYYLFFQSHCEYYWKVLLDPIFILKWNEFNSLWIEF